MAAGARPENNDRLFHLGQISAVINNDPADQDSPDHEGRRGINFEVTEHGTPSSSARPVNSENIGMIEFPFGEARSGRLTPSRNAI
jgi:hypothetical protein